MQQKFSCIQPINPTKKQRHKLLINALNKVCRLNDYNNIISLLNPPEEITSLAMPGIFKGIKIGIIGAGLAGLSSAFELRKIGFNITLFEASENRIGGRVYTYYFDKDKKLYGELGPMRIPVSHETTWHYIDLFNLKTRPFIQDNPNAFIYLRNTRVRNDPKGKNVMEKIYPKYKLTKWEKRTPWQKLVNYGFGIPLLNMPPTIRKEILQIKSIYHPQLLFWTRLNMRQVLEFMGLSQGAIDLISNVVPLAGSFYYYSYIEFLQEEYPQDFAYLYEIVDGLSSLPYAFYNSLISENPKEYKNISIDKLGKVIFKTGCIVTGIYNDNVNNKVLIKYKIKNSNQEIKESFDYIICAIPFSTLRTIEIYPLFSNNKMQAIKEVNYANAQKTLFLCNKRFWEEGSPSERIIGGGSHTDLPISSIWYPSDHATCNSNCSPYDPGVLLASYNFNLDAVRLGNLEDNDRFTEIKREIEMVHGLKKGYLDSIVTDYKTIQWNNELLFRGAFCYFLPEQKKLFSYTMIKPEFNNKVFFAGEHTSPKHGWMQGALNSGMKAANKLVEKCIKERP
ncbi:flavin monoamine oxidase family protein [Caloranaerobacter sp. DY30410]|uniref:flavin monoamine oxidase family protein n=1 Tax=Caloranaerobacter sp. DY30410 TaxID=3238305 RepID=UPI003D01AD36